MAVADVGMADFFNRSAIISVTYYPKICSRLTPHASRLTPHAYRFVILITGTIISSRLTPPC